jgi:hypothetical protein
MRPPLTEKYQFQFKRRKRARHRRLLMLSVAAFLVIVVGAFYYFTSGRFQVRDVIVRGLKDTSEDDARQVISFWLSEKSWYVLPHKVLWLASVGDISARLKTSLPTVKDIYVTKKYPDELTFDFKEYDGWGVLCHGDPEQCFWIDRSGVAFSPASEFSGIIIPKIRDMRERDFRLGEKQLSPNLMRLITYYNEKAPDNDYLQSLQFTIDKKDATLKVATRGGWNILLLETSDPEKSYNNLKTTLEGEVKDKASKLEYVDLRFGNRIFYKFKE